MSTLLCFNYLSKCSDYTRRIYYTYVLFIINCGVSSQCPVSMQAYSHSFCLVFKLQSEEESQSRAAFLLPHAFLRAPSFTTCVLLFHPRLPRHVGMPLEVVDASISSRFFPNIHFSVHTLLHFCFLINSITFPLNSFSDLHSYTRRYLLRLASTICTFVLNGQKNCWFIQLYIIYKNNLLARSQLILRSTVFEYLIKYALFKLRHS